MLEGEGMTEWLNPKSMTTPGVAGGLTLMITNTLGNSFGTPLAWTALAISALFGLIVLVVNAPIWQRAVFWILNSLIIFCVAMGSNIMGIELAPRAGSNTTVTESSRGAFEASSDTQSFFKLWEFR